MNINSNGIEDPLILEEMSEYLYNDTIPPKKEEVCISIDEKVILTYGNFSVVVGAPKSRKSTYAIGLLLSFLTKKKVFNSVVKNEGKAIYIDTEQSHYDFYRNMQRIKKIAGVKHLDAKKYQAFLFRMLTAQDIITHIEFLLMNDKSIKLLFIDSITDLVDDINSIQESKELIQKFKRWTTQYNIAIMSLLHLSKTTQFSLGHLGSYSDRGSQSTLCIERSKSNTYESSITPKFMRSDMEFENFTINFSDSQEEKQETVYWKDEKIPELIPDAIHIQQLTDIRLHIGKEISYKDLWYTLKSRYDKGDNFVKQKLIPYLKEHEFIKKEGNNYLINH